MSSFDDRENAFENKFAHDAAMQFKAEARRNRALAEWAAGLLGKSGDDVDAYAKEVMAADFEEAGDEDVIRKLVADLDGKADEAAVRAQVKKCMAEVKAELMNEG